mmetsp:Transcript_93669/g.264905  ORF Transcript_93669/g.264905 Transcript_93669/m.264905 type:complete len:125 (-) Transcript_93669:18-392(-)
MAEPFGATGAQARPNVAKRKKRLFHNQHMADRARQAAEARRELYDTFALSDAWLMSMIVGFSILGNTYRVRHKSEIYVGVVLFCLCFCVYVLLKHLEKAAAREQPEGDEPDTACERTDDSDAAE